jgi:MFS family permease
MARTAMSAQSVRYAWYAAGLLTLTLVVSYLDRFLPSLLVQPIKHDLRLSDFQIGLLLGPAFVFFYVVLGVPLGWLADRASRRGILAAGVAIWCMMTAAAAAVTSFVPLFVTRLGVGIGEATVAPASVSLIGDYFGRERQPRAMSLLMSGAFLGAGFSFLFFGPLVHYIQSLPPLMLPVLGRFQSWRLCFILVGLPGLVLAAFLLTLREPERRERIVIGAGPHTGMHPRFSDGVAYILRRWRAFGTLFIASGCSVMLGALAFWNVALFQRTWGWNVAQVGVAVGLILFTAGPVGTLLGVFLTNRDLALGKRDATLRALFTGLLIGVPTYILFPLMPSARIGLIVLFCSVIGQAMATAAGPATLVMLAPGPIRAQATAIYYLVINVIAQLIGPPLVGLITDLLGGPEKLRYAVALEPVLIGVPSMLLVWRGFAAYRRSVVELDGRSEAPRWTADQALQGAQR